jgi:glucose-6-phosphate 1-dehydrogenase
MKNANQYAGRGARAANPGDDSREQGLIGLGRMGTNMVGRLLRAENQAKVGPGPGERMEGRCIELIAHYQPPDEMEPYQRLLGDAISGDATLFAREDSVEHAWRVVDPILGNRAPLYEYEPGTWGPPEAGQLAPEGGWHDPEPGGMP